MFCNRHIGLNDYDEPINKCTVSEIDVCVICVAMIYNVRFSVTPDLVRGETCEIR